jgi:hypothetical protein
VLRDTGRVPGHFTLGADLCLVPDEPEDAASREQEGDGGVDREAQNEAGRPLRSRLRCHALVIGSTKPWLKL